ncbi:MAG: dockerin type I domain-containing protein, partial [Candidatus Zixiibacteriota bacterium]
PDSINHTTATWQDAWLAGLGEQLYIQFAFQINETGTFCVDSADFPGTTYDWLFDFPMPFNGPYCWEVVTELPQDPEIGVSPASFQFNGMVGGSAPDPQVLHITNTAAGTLEWTATWNSSWLTVNPSYGTAPSYSQISVNISGLTAGIYLDTIVISDPDALNNPVKIPIRLNLQEPPSVIDLSQTYFSFSAVADDVNPPDQYLTVDNAGGGSLNWTAFNSGDWLSINPSMGSDGDEITLSVDISGLAYGVYYDTIIVNDLQATNSPQKAAVRLEIVSSLPVLSINPVDIYVVVDVDNPWPDDKSFTISNSGAGTMNYYIEEASARIISFTPDSGSVPQTVTVQFDSIPGSSGQNFKDTAYIYSFEAVNSPQMIIFHYSLKTDPSRIYASKSAINFEIYECGQGMTPFSFPSLSVYDIGTGDVYYTLAHKADWLDISPMSGYTPQLFTMNYKYKLLAPGEYYDTLIITANSAINSPVIVPVTMTILPTSAAPVIWAEHNHFTWGAQENKAGKGYISSINNVNPGCMSWNFDDDVSWITYFIDSSNNQSYPWNIRYTPNGYGMVMGHYEDTIFVNAPDATNNPYPIAMDISIWKYYGDVNYDGKINIIDIVYLIAYLYKGGPEPQPERRVGDCNCNNAIDILDIVEIIDYLYYGSGPLCGNPI